MQPNVHYTYIHRRVSDGAPFYVGKGSGRRAWGSGNRSRAWHEFVADGDFVVEIVSTFQTAAEAFECERLVIARLRSEGYALTNATDGGSGSGGRDRGRPLSERTKKKLRQAHLGKKQSAETVAKRVEKVRGMRRTPEQRAAMKAAAEKRALDPEYRKKISMALTGRTLSPETRAKMSASLKGKNSGPRSDEFKKACSEAQALRAKPVICVENGMVFATQRQAVEWLVSSGKANAVQSNISSACRGRVKTAYGFQWSFADQHAVKVRQSSGI